MEDCKKVAFVPYLKYAKQQETMKNVKSVFQR